MTKKSFASDNFSGVHPEVFAAMVRANSGHAGAYGHDPYTVRALKTLESHFGKNIDAYFVYNGTASNILGIKTLTQPYHAVLCAESSHLNTDECGGPEHFTGCKLIPIPSGDGKIDVPRLRPHLKNFGNPHRVQPRVVSITQATELGTIYTIKEIRAIADFAHRNGLYLHMDGARLCNAAARLNVGLRKITRDAGVDVLSFGGTKNGMMFGEAVIFFNRTLSKEFRYVRKQGMQLASKMRFIAVQFEALFAGDLWLKNARHANRMAEILLHEVERIPGIRITQKVEANAVFAIVPRNWIPSLQKTNFFYVWDDEKSEVRWMCSYDTTRNDVEGFIREIKRVMRGEKANGRK
jgi:threonine aldolase